MKLGTFLKKKEKISKFRFTTGRIGNLCSVTCSVLRPESRSRRRRLFFLIFSAKVIAKMKMRSIDRYLFPYINLIL